MLDGRTTLTQFIIEEQRRVIGASGDFSGLLNDIATACKCISNAVSRGALAGVLGKHGEDGAVNVQGEAQKKIDVIANDVMLSSNVWAGHLAGMASEEMEDFFPIPPNYPCGKYLLLFDPLDGSSNSDTNMSVGTIFSILLSSSAGEEARLVDFLQPGVRQVCAGFALYGPATMLILTTGNGVDAFTLDREIGEFVLTHPQMTIPEESEEFAINASNERFWEPPVRRYVEECFAGKAGVRGKDFNMRWVASLVADTYRILTRGGVFLYPLDSKTKAQGGRLRLLYEANPIAFLVEQAGGAAITGRGRVMDVVPTALHQRAPLIFGSRREIERIAGYHLDYISGKDSMPVNSPLFSTRSLFRTQ
jgi:fructose-1,6-bisphosphatase I